MSRRNTEIGLELENNVQIEILAALVQVSPPTEEQNDQDEERNSPQHTEDFNAS